MIKCIIFFFTFIIVSVQAEEQITHFASDTKPLKKEIQFTPPSNWRFAENKDLPPSVKLMVIGKGVSSFPPSINLGVESYPGTLKQYLKRVKELNQKNRNEWKDLGIIETEAGKGSLSQVDKNTEWGEVRMMHLILKNDNFIYILNAAALKDEFPSYYKEFFKAFQSVRFGS